MTSKRPRELSTQSEATQLSETQAALESTDHHRVRPLDQIKEKLHHRLGLPRGHYWLHRAVMGGLSVTLVSELAKELGLPHSQVAKWVSLSGRRPTMTVRSAEVFLRLVETLDALLELHSGEVRGALKWLSSPCQTLASERPIDLLVSTAGHRSVMQAIHSIDYGLCV